MSNTQRSIYRIEILNSSGTLIADVSSYAKTRHFVLTRNREETVDMTFDQGQIETLCSTLGLTVRSLFQPGANDIRITRDTRVLLRARINYLATAVDQQSRVITLRAGGYLGLFKYRYLEIDWNLVYTSTDISAIAWDWINKSQTDVSYRTHTSFGITEGTLATSRSYTNTWQPYGKTIYDELVALTQVSQSIDLEITPNLVFNTYYPGMGTTHNELAFTYPGNIKKLNLPIDATLLANIVYERGSGNGTDQQFISASVNSDSLAIYQMREYLQDQSQMNISTILYDLGNEYLRLYENPTLIPDITLDGNQPPYLGSYWLGDWVPLNIRAGSAFTDLNGQIMRINQIDVTIDENDSEEIALKMGLS